MLLTAAYRLRMMQGANRLYIIQLYTTFMNRRAVISVNALRKTFEKDDNVLLCIVFGSQARGTERPDSDLDLLCILKRITLKHKVGRYRHIRLSKWGHIKEIQDVIINTKGAVRSMNTIIETQNTLKTNIDATLYGTTLYRALHEGIIIYKGKGSENIIRDYVENPFINLKRHADAWMKKAFYDIHKAKSISPYLVDIGCDDMERAIHCMLRALFVSRGIQFPFGRNFKILYDILDKKERETLFKDINTKRILTWGYARIMKRQQRVKRGLRLSKDYQTMRPDLDYGINAAEKVFKRILPIVWRMAARDYDSEIWDIVSNCTHMDDFDQAVDDISKFTLYNICADTANRALDYMRGTKLRELQKD